MRFSSMTSRLGFAAVGLAAGIALAGAARADEGAPPPHNHWGFEGVFGTFDRAALQRGFQVYKTVCSACHPVTHLYIRNLGDIGYSEEQVKGIAATYEVTDGPNDEGQMFQRPGRPYDRIPGPFPNDKAARAANNGALPPDLSLIYKSREHGADHIVGVLTGYKDPPAGFTVQQGMYYNEHFPGHQIAMPPPLSDDAVTYADGTKADVATMAKDAATFLAWAAEPRLEDRHRAGFKVILFLVVASGIFYAAKRKIWAHLH